MQKEATPRPAAHGRRFIAFLTVFTFTVQLILPPAVLAQGIPQTLLNLPVPGTMLGLSAPYTPALMTGITIHPENPLQFDFLVDTGDDHLAGDALQNESKKLINYFMASLTVPENEMWVNLSPHEKNRIVADGLSKTEMGRDMLAQDYLLKQLAASLLYPGGKTGAEFWKRVRAKAQEKFGTADIPTDLFNKVWIVPEEASVYVHGNNVFVTESRLKVMLEQDYVASSNAAHPGGVNTPGVGLSAESAQLIREVILPEIEKEINEGKNFSNLRQIYHSMILATWYKGKLKNSILGQAYLDKNKTGGIELEDKGVKEKIYDQYLEALKKGVYNYIKEDYDAAADETIPRKYFSGGLRGVTRVAERNRPSVAWMAKQSRRDFAMVAVNADVMGANLKIPDRAMLSTGNFMKAVDLLKDFLARDKSSDFYQELSEYGPVFAVISSLNLSDEMANVVEAIIGPRFIITYRQLSASGREFTLEQLFEQAQKLVLENLKTLTSENWQKSQLVILFALVPYVHPGSLHPNDRGNSKIENFDIGGHKITGLAETHWDPHAVQLLREVLQADNNFIPSQGKDWVFALESSEELLSRGQFLGDPRQLALKIADVFDIPVIYPVLNRSNDLVVREALARVSARYQGITLEDIAGFLADSLAEQVFDRDLRKAADVMARGWGSLMTAGDIILAGERWRASSEEGSDAKARAIDSVLHEVESEWTARKLQNELKQHPDRKKVLFLAGYHHVDAMKVYFQGEEFSIKGDDLRNLQSWLANLDNKYFLREEAQGVHSPVDDDVRKVDDDVRKMEFKLSRSPGYPALPSQARIEDWRMLISLEQLFRLLENIEATYWYMNFELISMFVGARGTLKYPQLFDKARVRRIASRNFNKENLMIASWLFSLQEKLGLIASNTSHLPEGSFAVFSNGNLGWEKGKGDKNDSLPDKIEFVRLFGADKKSRSKAGLFSVRTEGNGAPERLRGLTPDEVVNFTRLLTRELKVRKHLRQESNTQEITIFHEALTDFFIDLGQIYDVKTGNRRSDMAMMGEGEVTVATISDKAGKWTHEELKLYFKLLNDPVWVADHLGGHSPDVTSLKELVANRLFSHIIDESRGKKSNGKFFFRRLSNFGNPRYSFNVLQGWRVWNDGGTQSSGVNMSSVRVVFSAKEALKADPSESVLAELSEDGIHFEALGYKAVLDLDGNLTVEPLAGTTEPPVTLGSYFKDIFSIFGVDAVDITPGSQGKFTEMLKKLLEEQGITVTGVKGMDALGAEDVKTAGLAHDSKDLVIINGMVNSDSIEPALRILLNSGKLIITFAQSEASQEVSRAIEDAKKEIRRLSGVDRKFEYVLVGEDGEVVLPPDYPAAAGMPSLSERMLLVIKRIRADSYISAPDRAMTASEHSPEDVHRLLNAVKEEIVKNGSGAFTALRYLYQRDPRIPGDMRDDFFQRRRALASVYVELNPGRNIPATELYTTLKRQIADFRLARDHSRLKFNNLQFALDQFYAYAERQGLLQGEGASELLAAVVTMKDQLEALRNELRDDEQPIDWFDRAQEFDSSVSTGASLKALIEESETRAAHENQRRSATWGTSELARLNSSDRQLLSAIKEKAAGPGQAVMIAKAAALYGLKPGDLLIKDDQVVIVEEIPSPTDPRIFFYVTFDPGDLEGLLLTRVYNENHGDDGIRSHALGSADLDLHQFKHYRPLPDFYKKSGDRAMMGEFIDPADLAVQEIHANADGRKLFVLGHSHFDPVTHSQFEEAMHRLVEAALISDFQEARSLLDQMSEIMNAHQDLLKDFRRELKDLQRAISSLKIKVIGMEEDFGEGPGITKQEFELHQTVLRSLVKQIYPGDVKRLVDNLLLLHYGTERYLFFKEGLGKQGILLVGVDSGEKIKQNEAGFNSTLKEFFAIFDYITQNGGNLKSIHERLSFIQDEMGANSAIEPDEAKVAQWVGSFEDSELQRLVRQWIDSFAKTLRQTHARDPIIAENSLKVFEQHEDNVLIVVGAKHVSGIKKYFADLKSPDQAMTAEQATPGGIDFNAKNLNLKEQGSAVEIPFNFESLEGLRPEQVNGILPVIINITPVPTIIPLLGLAADKEEQLSAL